MDRNIITLIITFLGTAIGTFSGIYQTGKLTVYRIEQLEKKMDLYNSLNDKLISLEQSCKQAHKRIDEMVERENSK